MNAKVVLTFNDNKLNNYTGMFQKNQSFEGWVRFSYDQRPLNGVQNPAMSVKVFRNGLHSADLVTMHDWKGTTNQNFFGVNISTSARAPCNRFKRVKNPDGTKNFFNELMWEPYYT